MKVVQFDPRAETEFLQGAQYYEDQELGLGTRFIKAIKVAVRVASANPHIHREISEIVANAESFDSHTHLFSESTTTQYRSLQSCT